MLNSKYILEMQSLKNEIDMDFVMREVKALTDIEYPQTFEARANSTKYVEALLMREGLRALR